PIGDPSSSAIAVIDRDHTLDAVQLNGGGKIVPKRHADRRTCDDELAELPGQVLLDRVPVYGLLHARIDTGQNHGLIVSFGREREIRNEGEGSGTNADGADEVPAIERRCKTAAACAGNLMQISHCPSLGDGGTQLILAGIRCRRKRRSSITRQEHCRKGRRRPTIYELKLKKGNLWPALRNTTNMCKPV